MTWQSGQQLQAGKYIIQEELGEGGFGITYKAQHTLLNSSLVIKTPNRKLRKDPEYPKYVKRFLKEAQTLAKLSAQRHPHIVQVKDLFEEGDIPCLVMEFIQGESLFHFVQRQGAIKESQAINYIQQIGEALSLIHQAGLVHRDAHPGNIMIQNSQNCILIDFGLASEIVPVASSTKHPANLAFAPLEQMFGSCEITVDIYTLAASLYYAVTGEVPTPNLYKRSQGDELKEPKEFTQISDILNQAIVKGLEFDPKNRPQTIENWLSMFPPTTTPAAPNVASVPLVSARGVDYQKLQDLLKAGKWREADQETLRVMLKVAHREKAGLRVEDIDNFPCEDLRTIDQLWVKYSHGRFGFSVQKRIYQSLGGTREFDGKIWQAFADRVGWRVNNNWLDYHYLTFSTSAPEGHLPINDWVGMGLLFSFSVFGGLNGVCCFFSRVETCKV
jgi:serine/threonine protein kinase